MYLCEYVRVRGIVGKRGVPLWSLVCQRHILVLALALVLLRETVSIDVQP